MLPKELQERIRKHNPNYATHKDALTTLQSLDEDILSLKAKGEDTTEVQKLRDDLDKAIDKQQEGKS